MLRNSHKIRDKKPLELTIKEIRIKEYGGGEGIRTPERNFFL
jgi:hypothetical protein